MTTPPAPAPEERDALEGARIGKYEVGRLLGRGGMGSVHEAVHTGIGKRVAMKFIDPTLATDREAVARFQREAQAASLVESEHIVEIFDSGTTEDGRPYLVMELLRGEDLRQLVRRLGRLPPDAAATLVADVLRGLGRAHEAGIVHRDLKPDNVFLVARDERPCFAKIVDFGISKIQPGSAVPTQTLTREGAVIGTPYYMSPEQALGRADVDHRTDLWAVGAILFECLTGRPPHLGKSYEEVIVAICSTDADDVRALEPSVPDALAEVVMGALCRDREGRFASAREMLDALQAAAAAGPAPGHSRAQDTASGPSLLERRWLSVVLALLAGGALVGWLFYRLFVLQYFR